MSEPLPTVRDMTELLSLCDAQTTLKPIEQVILERFPEPAHEIAEEPQCELQDGHAGPHMALAQETQGKQWWVVWAPDGGQLRAKGAVTERRLYPMDDCTATVPGEEDEECGLMAGHSGAHSFAMESSGPRTPSSWARKKMAAALRGEMEGEELAYFEELEGHLNAPGAPLPLITQGEVMALAMMLRLHADEDWVLEGLAETLLDRIGERMDAPA